MKSLGVLKAAHSSPVLWQLYGCTERQVLPYKSTFNDAKIALLVFMNTTSQERTYSSVKHV
jgi:hypothetical protein